MSELRTVLKDLPPECQKYVNRFINKRPIIDEDLSANKGYCTLLPDCNACILQPPQTFTDNATEGSYAGLKKGFLQGTQTSAPVKSPPSSNLKSGEQSTFKSEKSTQSKPVNAAKACSGPVPVYVDSEPLLDGLSVIYRLIARDGAESMTKLMCTMLTFEKKKSIRVNPNLTDQAPTALDAMSLSEKIVINCIKQLATMQGAFYTSPQGVLEVVRDSRDMHSIVLFVQDAFGEMFQMDDEQSNDEPSDQCCSIEEGCDYIFYYLEDKGYRKTVTMILKCFEILKTLNSSTAIVKASKDKQRSAISSYLKQRALYDEEPEVLYSFIRLHPVWRQLVMAVWNVRC